MQVRTGSLVLVTGAGSGIGRATSERFARAGARVLAVDIDLASAEKTVAGLACPGRAYALDVRDSQATHAFAADIHAEHGPLDVLVNNAGVGMTGRFADMTIADWEWIRSVNLDGVVNGCHAFGPAMLAAGKGHVVNLSSGLAYTMRATEPAYVTTKAAVLALSQCLRADWRPRGVSVTAVCPGVINTPIIDRTRFIGDQADAKAVERTKRMFRRGHSAETVANAIFSAVQSDKIMVAPGFESAIGWYLHRLLPLRAQQILAKA